MIECDYCGAQSPDGSEYCERCGKDFAPPRKEDFETKKKKKEPKVALTEVVVKQEKPKATGKKKSKKILLIVVAVIVAIAVLALFFLMPTLSKKESCRERWSCTDWGPCVGGLQSRTCTDGSRCGTYKSRPEVEQSCGAETSSGAVVAAGTATNNSATTPEEPEDSCGDGECADGEDCSSCQEDCGACSPRQAAKIYTEPLSMPEDEQLRKDGYVIVRYYYASNCDACKSPTDVEQQLEEMASQYSDIMVLVSINTVKYSYDSKRYGGINGIVYKPTIRADGIKDGQPGYGILFGVSLVEKLKDGDVTKDISPIICEHSDNCEFRNGQIARV